MRLKEKLHYHAHSAWDKETGGSADTGNFHVPFDMPEEYGGKEIAPCPDQLFLAGITGCLMNTFLFYKNELGAETLDIKVDADAEITLMTPHGYRMTGIDIRIDVRSDEENHELNRKCAENARDFCHITKSIEASIPTKVDIKIHEN